MFFTMVRIGRCSSNSSKNYYVKQLPSIKVNIEKFKLQSLLIPNKMNKLSKTKQMNPLGNLGKSYQHYYFISIFILFEFADKRSRPSSLLLGHTILNLYTQTYKLFNQIRFYTNLSITWFPHCLQLNSKKEISNYAFIAYKSYLNVAPQRIGIFSLFIGLRSITNYFDHFSFHSRFKINAKLNF